MIDQDELFKRIQLRDLILAHFSNPGRGLGLVNLVKFEGYTSEEIRTAVRALAATGLLAHVRGDGPGAIYHTTDDGIILLESLGDYTIRTEI